MTRFWDKWPSPVTELVLSAPTAVVLAAITIESTLALYERHLVKLNPFGVSTLAIIFALFYEKSRLDANGWDAEDFGWRTLGIVIICLVWRLI